MQSLGLLSRHPGQLGAHLCPLLVSGEDRTDFELLRGEHSTGRVWPAAVDAETFALLATAVLQRLAGQTADCHLQPRRCLLNTAAASVRLDVTGRTATLVVSGRSREDTSALFALVVVSDCLLFRNFLRGPCA